MAERAGTRSDGREQGRSSADGGGEDRAVVLPNLLGTTSGLVSSAVRCLAVTGVTSAAE